MIYNDRQHLCMTITYFRDFHHDLYSLICALIRQYDNINVTFLVHTRSSVGTISHRYLLITVDALAYWALSPMKHETCVIRSTDFGGQSSQLSSPTEPRIWHYYCLAIISIFKRFHFNVSVRLRFSNSLDLNIIENTYFL